MSIIGSLIGAGTSIYNTDMQIRENARDRQFQAEQAKLAYERSLSADSSKFQRTVADLKAAGLNPMLALGQSGGTVHSPAASGGATSTVPLNLGDALALQDFELRKRKVDAEVANTEADTEKKKSETVGLNIDNEVKEFTKTATVESASLRNQLDRAKIRQIDGQLDEIQAIIKKMAAETKTEEEKQSYYAAAAMLSSANAKQITELLPYEKMLKSATSDGQRAASALAAAHTAYQNKLIDDGYIDAFIAKAKSESSSAESKASLDAIAAALRTGDYSKIGDTVIKDSFAKKLLQDFTVLLDNLNPLNNLFK